MRGHGSLQQLLGKRVTGKKKPGQDEATNSSKRQRQAGSEVLANTTAQGKLHAFFKPQQADKQHLKSPGNEKPPRNTRSSVKNTPETARKPSIPPTYAIKTKIVGRRHQAAADGAPPFVDSELLLVREPDNQLDPAAIKVCTRTQSGHLRTHGHLPAAVSAHLAPLIDQQQVSVTARFQDAAAVGSDRNTNAGQYAEDTQQQYAHAAANDQAQASAIGVAGSSSTSAAGGSSSSSYGALTRMGSGIWRVNISAAVNNRVLTDKDASNTVIAALQSAAAAGSDGLDSGKNTGGVLAAAFEHILQQTRQHDLHLLDSQEQAVLLSVQALAAPDRSLLLRLLLRKRRWFQLSALSYSDVPDVLAAAQQLRSAGLIRWCHEAQADLDSLLPELPVVLLKAVLAKVLPKSHPAIVTGAAAGGVDGKAALVSSIQSNACRQRLQAAVCSEAGDWLMIQPLVQDTFVRLQHIYFLNQGQDLGMFVAVDRGALRYPTYAVWRSRSVFDNRQALLAYEAAVELAAQVNEALEADEINKAWQLLQPALAALRAGVHKTISWNEQHGAVMPNKPVQQQQQQRPHMKQQQGEQHQQQQVVALQSALLPDIQSPRHRSPSKSSFNMHSGRLSRSRSRSPSPSSNNAGSCADSDCEADSATSCSNSYSSRGITHSSSTISSTGIRASSRRTPAPPALTRSRAAAAAAALRAAAEDPAEGAAAGQRGPVRQRDRAWPQPPTASAATPVAPPLFLARFCAGWVHASLGTVAVSVLEKQKRWSDAVDLLRLLLGGNACVGRRGEWWERLAINLEHLGLPEQALEAVESSLADSWVRGGDLLGLQRRCLRLGRPPRRWRRPGWASQAEWEPRETVITGRPLNCNTGSKSRFYGLDGSLVTVEELALQHYGSEAGGRWQGLHSEGGVWATLFGLLLWDVIFTDVPDVFRSPFQVAPLDLDSDAFYPTRREQLDKRLTQIADGQAVSVLSSTWAAQCGVYCRGVSWQRFSQQQLLDICECVGGLGLAAVLRLMAEDHAGVTGGLPDLLLWRKADNAAKVVEVKGPRDRLSNQQRFWLAHMANSNIQVEVCKVREPSVSSKR